MKKVMNSTVCITLILVCCVVWVACTFPVALSCDSCGRECTAACGTRHFRTCCFNYLRKRSSLSVGPTPPGLKLELWLAQSQQMEQAARNALINENEKQQAADSQGKLIEPEGGRLQLIYDA